MHACDAGGLRSASADLNRGSPGSPFGDRHRLPAGLRTAARARSGGDQRWQVRRSAERRMGATCARGRTHWRCCQSSRVPRAGVGARRREFVPAVFGGDARTVPSASHVVEDPRLMSAGSRWRKCPTPSTIATCRLSGARAAAMSRAVRSQPGCSCRSGRSTTTCRTCTPSSACAAGSELAAGLHGTTVSPPRPSSPPP